MPTCKFCNEGNLEWYQGIDEKWKLGIKLDINNFRKHICITQEKTGNKRNWIEFSCTRCRCMIRQNVKLTKPKELNLCYDCSKSC